MANRGTFAGAALAAVAAVSAAGCSYSSYQTAHMLPRGGMSVTGSINQYGYQTSSGGGGGGDQAAIELMGNYGLNDKVEIGGKVGWFFEDADTLDFLVVPKISLVPDKLALTIPAGLILAYGDNADGVDNAWLLMPGLVFTHRLHEYFELNLCGKPVIGLQDDFSDYNIAGALNVGVRLTPPGQSWSLFPEVGFMYDDDSENSDDYYLHLGVAFTWEFGTQAAAPAPAPAPPPAAP